jgi:hypothetical protein
LSLEKNKVFGEIWSDGSVMTNDGLTLGTLDWFGGVYSEHVIFFVCCYVHMHLVLTFLADLFIDDWLNIGQLCSINITWDASHYCTK